MLHYFIRHLDTQNSAQLHQLRRLIRPCCCFSKHFSTRGARHIALLSLERISAFTQLCKLCIYATMIINMKAHAAPVNPVIKNTRGLIQINIELSPTHFNDYHTAEGCSRYVNVGAHWDYSKSHHSTAQQALEWFKCRQAGNYSIILVVGALVQFQLDHSIHVLPRIQNAPKACKIPGMHSF